MLVNYPSARARIVSTIIIFGGATFCEKPVISLRSNFRVSNFRVKFSIFVVIRSRAIVTTWVGKFVGFS